MNYSISFTEIDFYPETLNHRYIPALKHVMELILSSYVLLSSMITTYK